MLKVGLTGGMGSGKSSVAALFLGLGVPVIDCDAINRELVKPGQAAFNEIIAHWGAELLTPSGTLNRDLLREWVFSDLQEKKWLEQLLHPLIKEKIKQRVNLLDSPYCLIEIPLLIEAGFSDVVDRILVVHCAVSQQITRVQARDNLSKETIEAMLATQATSEQRFRCADDLIENISTLAVLQARVKTLDQQYRCLR